MRGLNHSVTVTDRLDPSTAGPCDILVALHARKSFPAVEAYHEAYPDRPVLVVLTGTDLYQDLRKSDTRPTVLAALELATRIIALQSEAGSALPFHLTSKIRVIYQSAVSYTGEDSANHDSFDVCVLGHLRPVKDPFRTAEAARLLPENSRIQVIQIGAALSPEMAERAEAEAANNPRYHWLGELLRSQALRILSRCRLMVLTSLLEGGANVISEALAASVPVISSRIEGSIGMLGSNYPGYFQTGDTQELTNLLERAETDPGFYKELQNACVQRAYLVEPARESEAWSRLLRELVPV